MVDKYLNWGVTVHSPWNDGSRGLWDLVCEKFRYLVDKLVRRTSFGLPLRRSPLIRSLRYTGNVKGRLIKDGSVSKIRTVNTVANTD